MAGVFINYRREDASGYAGALMRELEKRFDPKDVFMDIADIPGGEEFSAVLDEAIRSCDVVLALIGSRWAEITDAQGRQRLSDPNDYVRREILAAWQHDVRVIPVLLGDAVIPKANQLPAELQTLPNFNAMRLSDRHWERDVDGIGDEIRKAMYSLNCTAEGAGQPAAPIGFDPGQTPGRWTTIIGGLILVFGLIFGFIAVALTISDKRFAARALQAEGIVVDFKNQRDNFHPVITFHTVAGQAVTFESGMGSTPPEYEVGEKLGVLYDPQFPAKAKIKSDLFWFLPLIFGLFGTVGLAIGILLLAVALRRRKQWQRKLRLLKEGRPVMTAFCEAEIDSTLSVNGQHPYRVVTEWTNPLSGQRMHFRSEYVWKDPTDLLRQRSITVILDPTNLDHHLVDLSFVPDDFKRAPLGSSVFVGWSTRRQIGR